MESKDPFKILNTIKPKFLKNARKIFKKYPLFYDEHLFCKFRDKFQSLETFVKNNRLWGPFYDYSENSYIITQFNDGFDYGVNLQWDDDRLLFSLGDGGETVEIYMRITEISITINMFMDGKKFHVTKIKVLADGSFDED